MPIATIRLQNDALIPALIQGAVIEFYETDGTFITSGVSDVDGEVTVTLPADEYDVLFFKIGMSVLPKQPQRIEVLDQIPPNVFLVTAHERVLPESPDPTTCRVSGYIINSHGDPQKDVKITIGNFKELVVDNGRLVDPDHQVSASTDEDGYMQFDLLRGQRYEVFFLFKDVWNDMPPGRLCIQVPDAPAVLLQDLLFPMPVNVDFSQAAVSVGAGVRDETTILTIMYSDGNARQLPLEWGTYKLVNSDPSVFTYEVAGDKLIIIGVAAGTATLTAERIIPSATSWNPPPTFATDTLTVTVV